MLHADTDMKRQTKGLTQSRVPTTQVVAHQRQDRAYSHCHGFQTLMCMGAGPEVVVEVEEAESWDLSCTGSFIDSTGTLRGK